MAKIKTSKLKGDVLLIGGLGTESITTSIKSMGSSYIRRELKSSPSNWQKIIEFFEDSSSKDIACVLAQFTEYILFVACVPAYKELFHRLCELIAKRNHMVFVYADNLSGQFNYMVDDTNFEYFGVARWYRRYSGKTDLSNLGGIDKIRTDMKDIVKYLHSTLRIAPYRTRVDLNVSTQEFLEEVFRGLLMRIYIPNDRIWAGEIDKLLSLFAEYLQRVDGYPITLDENRTEKGLIYGFYSMDASVSKDQISGLLEKFSAFMEICANDPDKAAELLQDSNLPKEHLNSILTKYSKEARRLLIDIQYEKDAKLLSIRHRLQSELLDAVSVNEGMNALMAIDKTTSRNIGNPLDIINIPGLAKTGDTVIQSQTINIHNPQIIAQAKGIIAQELNGSIQYTEHDQRILELIEQHTSGTELLELKSSLDELKDQSAPQSQRTTAWQRVQGFLSKHSGTISKTALSLLEKYLEHLLTGK